MGDPGHKDCVHASPDPAGDCHALIAALRGAGAARFDPAGFHYINMLASRAATHHGKVRHALDIRLARVLATFQERFAAAKADAGKIVSRGMSQYPDAAADLQQLFAAGDFHALRQFVAGLTANRQSTPLGALLRQLEQHSPASADTRAAAGQSMDGVPRSELRAIRDFRNTWSKLSVDKQVAQALERAPTNAGPINSHMLVLRSLALMRDISPDYLNRFMSYADTLLCLDRDEKEKRAPAKRGPRTAKK